MTGPEPTMDELVELAGVAHARWRNRPYGDMYRAILTAVLPRVLEGAADWRPVTDEAKNGDRVLLWVCSRGSIRRGIAQIGWWGVHIDFGPTWLLRVDHPVDADAVKLWQPIVPPAAPAPFIPISSP